MNFILQLVVLLLLRFYRVQPSSIVIIIATMIRLIACITHVTFITYGTEAHTLYLECFRITRVPVINARVNF